MSSTASLGQSVEVTEITRPIKIAYIVPAVTNKENHWILDAIFHESYTRWGGARTLIIPSNKKSFLDARYEHWLTFFDPDVIYTYVDISKTLAKKIDRLCSPILLKKHPAARRDAARWSDLRPSLDTYLDAVSSLTTLHSPLNRDRLGGSTPLPRLLTQCDIESERFISDNFGHSWHKTSHTTPISGLFETFCFCSPKVFAGKSLDVGTEKTSSLTSTLELLANKKLHTFARLATLHSEGVSKIDPHKWSGAFFLFIGSTCLDRINFWNTRNLVPSWIGNSGALIVGRESFKDPAFIKVLGDFFNKNNYTSSSGGHQTVLLKSLSLSKETLEECASILREETYNSVTVRDNEFSHPALPEEKDFKDAYTAVGQNLKFKVNEVQNEIKAQEPEHFSYTPPTFIGLNSGNWAVDLIINRHNNLSRYSNVVDTWMLPKRKSAATCFTNKLSKVNKNHRLTLIPNSSDHPFKSTNAKQRLAYDLRLPSDERFFRFLILQNKFLIREDIRYSSEEQGKYSDMAISDKGQNLRGVISMFPNLSEAYEMLTNKFWREVICRDSENKPWKIERLHARIDRSAAQKERLKKELRLEGKFISKYLEANLLDSLEYLVERGVFYQVHSWRCSYCGHTNTLSVDEIKKKNECTICDTAYLLPIDAKCGFHLNEFVYSALYRQSGLAVLWGAGLLREATRNDSFYYLPEADLYLDPDHKIKEEIDTLCVHDGIFTAIEAKKSVLGFTRDKGRKSNKHIDKFINKIKNLEPDTALLVFEQYAEEKGSKDIAKRELESAIDKINKGCADINVKIQVLIASDYEAFNKSPIDLGVSGNRTSQLLYK